MCLAQQFVDSGVESKLVQGKFVAGRYDMQVLNDLRCVWGAKIDTTVVNHAAFEFKDGSKCMFNKDYEDWFLI